MGIKVISFHYTVTDTSGKKLDSSAGHAPLTFMEGANQIIPGLEKVIGGLSAGDKKQVNVGAAEAYGARNESLVVTVPKTRMPAQDIHVGDRFRGGPEEDAPIFIVTDVGEEEIKLDGNHPLAGQDLSFDIEITQVREATPEEIQHGHAHGDGGHSH